MNKKTIKDEILATIKNQIGENTSFKIKDLINLLPNIKYSTIKVNLKRIFEEGILKKAKNGIYFLPNEKRVLKDAFINTDDVVTKNYIENDEGDRIGYYSGINFANGLGLTTQTASIQTIYSNAVSDKSRIITIQNQKFKINSPRYKVTNHNYKILQVLDLVHNLDKYNEFDIETVLEVVKKYLNSVEIKKDELTKIIKTYPLKTQVVFYEIGVDHFITQE